MELAIIIINAAISYAILGHETVSNRIVSVKIKEELVNLNVIQIYMLERTTEGSN